MINWYNLSDDEKIKQVYSNYSLQDFWSWWSDDKNEWMEIRIKDINIIKQLANKYNLSWSASGVYINNVNDLKKVVSYTRDETVMWFGINPRRKAINYKGNKSFGGADAFVKEIKFLSIDIDRITKEGNATSEELENANILADFIINRMSVNGFNKSYCKICSGNGMLLLFKLDKPISVPTIEFIDKTKDYKYNEDYESIKRLIPQGIGKIIRKFCKNYDSLGMEVDKVAMNLGRVGALPFTKNFKYGSFTWRGIIELVNGKNKGLTDYIISYKEIINEKINNKMWGNKAAPLNFLIKEGSIRKNPLVRFMLENDFPNGQITLTLWYSLKCLLRDSEIDLNSIEFMEVYQELKTKHNRPFTKGISINDNFNAQTVNNYCIRNFLPIVYPNNLWEGNNIIKRLWDERKPITINEIEFVREYTELPSNTDIIEDLIFGKKIVSNRYDVQKFLAGIMRKYNKQKTEYLINNVIEKWFNYCDTTNIYK